ncbi:hypothetical protein [Paenibacillus silagei]|uniref:DUF4178 domain-containing protein n=1 Tax=Paenibacillus silagei TaxID=1670801 RepID=A0ABS4NXZ8_9BACL|nr:hypothetical protein [Paenibacillus silagei]MBP2114931.1 hypothetical protein [Paenibacillus silagei]
MKIQLRLEKLWKRARVERSCFSLEKISDRFILVKLVFDYDKVKDYYGRLVWCFYGEAEPLIIYFDKSRETYTSEEVLLPNELTFFVDSFSNKFVQNPQIRTSGLPALSLTTVEGIDHDFLVQERGELTVAYKDNSIYCLFNASQPDEIVQVGENIGFYFSNKMLSEIKLQLTDHDKLILQQAHLI